MITRATTRQNGNMQSRMAQSTLAGKEMWTPHEVEQILQGLALGETNDLLKLRVPNRSLDAVGNKARMLLRADSWNAAELRALYAGVEANKSAAEIAADIPTRTPRAIRAQLLANGLKARSMELGPKALPDGRSRRKERVIRAEKEQYTERRCMTCNAKFFSWGIGNRLCNEHRREG